MRGEKFWTCRRKGTILIVEKKLTFSYARLTQMLASQHLTVVVATVGLFHSVHAWNRENQPRYLEVFLDVPEDIRRERDSKGLYANNESDNQRLVAGIDTRVEFPLNPHLIWLCQNEVCI